MKKNVITLLAFVLVAGTVSAQTEMGNYLVGGNVSLNTAKNNTVVVLSPSVGYFFANNFAAGANVDFSYQKISATKITGFGIGPFARYYFGTSNTRPLLHANYNFTSNKTKSGTTTSTTTTVNGGNYFIGGGLAAFINRNVAIEGLAGYSHTKYRHANDNGAGGFNLRIGFQVYLSGAQMSKVTGQ